MIEESSDLQKPLNAAIRCPYCGVEGRTTMPPPRQVTMAEIEISHECPDPWQWKVVTR